MQVEQKNNKERNVSRIQGSDPWIETFEDKNTLEYTGGS